MSEIVRVTVVSDNYSSYYSVGSYTIGGGLVTGFDQTEDQILVKGYHAQEMQRINTDLHANQPESELNSGRVKGIEFFASKGASIDVLTSIDRRVPVTIDYY